MTTSVPTQQDGGATILEIGQQPDVWREISKRYDPALADFLNERHESGLATSIGDP